MHGPTKFACFVTLPLYIPFMTPNSEWSSVHSEIPHVFPFATMFPSIRNLSSTISFMFQTIWCHLEVVFRSISRNLLGRTHHTSDSEALDIPRISKNVSLISLNNYNHCSWIQDGANSNTDEPNAISHVEVVEVHPRYYPPRVSEIIGRGGECFIGVIDDYTVLKYPYIPRNQDSI